MSDFDVAGRLLAVMDFPAANHPQDRWIKELRKHADGLLNGGL